MDWVVQALPFHISANVTSWNALLAELPTASHESAAAHETALRKELVGPGVGCADQEVPFHAAAFSPDGPEPTASQELAETHETDIGCTEVPGITWSCHEVPFHISAAAPAAPTPTASQKLAATHETPKRLPLVGANWLV